MDLHELQPSPGSTHNSKRVGRGGGSGKGKTAGRGTKGQKARTGHHALRAGFEGGQSSIINQSPKKRGFTNIFRVSYKPVNIFKLVERFDDGMTVDPETLVKAGLVKNLKQPIKILGEGDLTIKLTVRAHKFSASAKQKIEEAGGTTEEVEFATPPTKQDRFATPFVAATAE